MLQIRNINLPVSYRQKDLVLACCKALRLKQLPEVRIMKRSLDARHKERIHYHITAGVSGFSRTEEERILRKAGNKNVQLYDPAVYHFPCKAETTERPVIIGTGPAGYFAGLMLARAGFRPILLERGKPVEERKKDVETFWNGGALDKSSNVSFGEGGAGTFSDGKLYTGNKDRDGSQAFVLETFHRFGAADEILYDAKPHIGTDVLYRIMQNLREEIRSFGGEIRFSNQVTGISRLSDEKENRISGASPGGDDDVPRYVVDIKLLCKQEGGTDRIITPAVILAVGHSARDTFSMLHEQGICMEKKPFAMGLRIEHPREMIDRCRYGDPAVTGKLPAADYKLICHTSEGRAVFSFCMCPGGYVVNASTEEGGTVVNGMSYSGRNGVNSNSALVVNILPEDIPGDSPMDSVEYQRSVEQAFYRTGGGKIPVQRYEDFCLNRATESPGSIRPAIKGKIRPANLRECLPDTLSRAIIEAIPRFACEIPGFDDPDAILSGVESRTSSPVRILRNVDLQAPDHPGFFPCGEGAGYAGGIMSAAVDGIHTAEAAAMYLNNLNNKGELK